ncbi:ComEC/Rec2 family competence protein [Polaribacter pacificus]|uniref:ComEC/Rec2 family competence protein n=1 Tax=Polaribacter pacificus TaxID=1775173 RepID=UPI0021D0975C|nr:ComEC/Rec2 family competence protein [Polaribacter pacificus]
MQSQLLLLSFLICLFVFHRIRKKILFTILTGLFFVFIGVFSVHFQKARHQIPFETKSSEQLTPVLIKLVKRLKTTSNSANYIAEIKQIGLSTAKGKLLFQVQIDTVKPTLILSDFLWVYGDLEKVQGPLNPHQFDYKAYLEKLDVYQRMTVKNGHWVMQESNAFSILRWADQTRLQIQTALKKLDFTSDEFGIINALLLGQRTELSEELQEDYTKAGAIHILAISGLHIGILLLLFNTLFKPLLFFKQGAYIKTILLVLLLWAFALIAGLSSSVIRATTMFSFVAIAMIFKSQTAVLHSLISSLFVLLLYNPLFLFDVGFQLSYAAVFGIVWMQPLIYKIWKPKVWLFRKAWQLTTVSIAAQLAVLPISLYYFHQFPALFIVSNLLIVPCLGFILFVGLLVIALSLFNAVPIFLVDAYGFIIATMNAIIQWIASQDAFVIEEIPFSAPLLLVSYACLISAFLYISKPKFIKLVSLLLAILCFQSLYFLEKWQSSQQRKFVVFHQTAQTVLIHQQGTTATLFHNLDSLSLKHSSFLKSYRIGERITRQTAIDSIPSLISFANKKLLIVDSLGVYQLNGLEYPIVLLRQSPKINLERLILSVTPSLVIADGSNYTSSIEAWEKICKNFKLPFYNTRTQGAFVFYEDK